MINTLALDIAQNTGWALRANGVTDFGSLDLKPYKDDHGEMGVFFQEWVKAQILEHDIGCLAVEPPFGISPNSEYRRGLFFLCEVIAVAEGIKRRFYKAGEWRARIMENPPRRSLPAKKAVKAWCEEAGFKPANYDESDALGILTCALMELED